MPATGLAEKENTQANREWAESWVTGILSKELLVLNLDSRGRSPFLTLSTTSYFSAIRSDRCPDPFRRERRAGR